MQVLSDLIVFLIRRIAFIVVSFQQVLDASIQLILLSYINLTFMVVYGYYMYHTISSTSEEDSNSSTNSF